MYYLILCSLLGIVATDPSLRFEKNGLVIGQRYNQSLYSSENNVFTFILNFNRGKYKMSV